MITSGYQITINNQKVTKATWGEVYDFIFRKIKELEDENAANDFAVVWNSYSRSQMLGFSKMIFGFTRVTIDEICS